MTVDLDNAPPPERSRDLAILLVLLRHISFEISGLVQDSGRISSLLGAAAEGLEAEIALAERGASMVSVQEH